MTQIQAIGKRDQRTLQARRYALVPQMRDYDTLEQKAWLPYIMVFHPERLRTKSFSTDERGFRRSMRDGHPLEWAEYDNPANRRGVVIGSSCAFGIGASSDAATLSSLLNKKEDRVWFNFAGRAFNSTQELLVFLLHLPRDIERIFIVSGANNLVLSYLSQSTSPIYNSFYAQGVFERGLRSGLVTGVRGSLKLVMRELADKLQSVNHERAPDGEAADKYDHVMSCFRRDMRLWALVREALRCPVYFALQPMAVWIEKVFTPEEEELFAILDACSDGSNWMGLSAHLRKQRDRYVGDLRGVCGELDIPFLNLNECQSFAERRWLFVDRAHLTDEGYRAVAEELLKAWPR